MIKRLIDILLSFFLLIVFLPLFVAIFLMIFFTSGLPVIFKQARPGFNSKSFNIFKFRTMTNKLDADGNMLPDQERLTKLGKFLRSTSLDELPTLWNVFKGDMSLVGPRPLLIEYLPLYSQNQSRRHDVKPGITGWAQVNGRNAISWTKKLDLDVWYVDHQSFFLDIKILLLTVKKVLSREGVTAEGEATTSRFRGDAK